MQSALKSIAAKLGKDVKADSTAICSALDTALAGSSASVDEMKAMQSQLADLLSSTSKDRAETVVDAAIAEQRVGVKGLRDHYIARHMASSDGAKAVEKELAGLPSLSGKLTGGDITTLQSADKDGLTAEDREVMAMMNADPKAFKAARAAELKQQEAL
ncbi:MAG: hypothetical protein GQ535_12290 [Rhodobacteraceae bacterium]|nr:hypothetical protein [Paracoccaceae bacterium]